MSESSLCFTNVTQQRYGRPALDLIEIEETGNPKGSRSSAAIDPNPKALERGPKPSRAAT
jgi:hypothetical protein